MSDPANGKAQALTNHYFARHASDWTNIYDLEGVKDLVHQERLRIVLDMVNELALPAGASVLDVGCGAGVAATHLAERGYKVTAVDPVAEMLEATRTRALKRGVDDKLKTQTGDANSLPFEDNAFMVVIAMGVLPWLPSIDRPLNEMARVLKPGGRLIVTTDNRWSLRWWLEPLNNPIIAPLKEIVQSIRRKYGRQASCAPWYPTSTAAIDKALINRGLKKEAGLTIGFGPITFLDRELLPGRPGAALNNKLQVYANRGTPVLRSMGCHYIVIASKPYKKGGTGQ
jgi:ubiquinone/menaquinone biosynthesis C-methylase UbiE